MVLCLRGKELLYRKHQSSLAQGKNIDILWFSKEVMCVKARMNWKLKERQEIGI